MTRGVLMAEVCGAASALTSRGVLMTRGVLVSEACGAISARITSSNPKSKTKSNPYHRHVMRRARSVRLRVRSDLEQDQV